MDAGPNAPGGDNVAKAWLLGRLAVAPLEQAPELVSREWVGDAPGFCEAVLAAVAADAPGRPDGGKLVELVGADPPALARAAEALRGAVSAWVCAREDSARHAALTDRTAAVVLALLADALAVPAASDPVEISITDARLPADRRGRLTDEAERLIGRGATFALLAVEVQDAAHLVPAALARAEAAVLAALPSDAQHAPDGPGSLLVLVPGGEGHAIAGQLTTAVEAAGAPHGVPLRAAAGVAQHPAHGVTPSALLAHADAQLFAARADGLPFVER